MAAHAPSLARLGADLRTIATQSPNARRPIRTTGIFTAEATTALSDLVLWNVVTIPKKPRLRARIEMILNKPSTPRQRTAALRPRRSIQWSDYTLRDPSKIPAKPQCAHKPILYLQRPGHIDDARRHAQFPAVFRRSLKHCRKAFPTPYIVRRQLKDFSVNMVTLIPRQRASRLQPLCMNAVAYHREQHHCSQTTLLHGNSPITAEQFDWQSLNLTLLIIVCLH